MGLFDSLLPFINPVAGLHNLASGGAGSSFLTGAPGQQSGGQQTTNLWGLGPQSDFTTWLQNYMKQGLQNAPPVAGQPPRIPQGIQNPNAGFSSFGDLGVPLGGAQSGANNNILPIGGAKPELSTPPELNTILPIGGSKPTQPRPDNTMMPISGAKPELNTILSGSLAGGSKVQPSGPDNVALSNNPSALGPFAEQLQTGELYNPLRRSLDTASQQYNAPWASPVAQGEFGAYKQQALADLLQNQLPGLQSMGAKYGLTGSSGLGQATGNVLNNYQNQLGSQWSNIMGRQQQMGQQQLLGGTQTLGQGAAAAGQQGLGSGQLDLASLLGRGNLGLSAGQLELQRGLGTGQLDLARMLGLGNLDIAHQDQAMRNWQTPLAIALGMQGLAPQTVSMGTNTQQQGTVTPPQSGFLQQMAGGAGGLGLLRLFGLG